SARLGRFNLRARLIKSGARHRGWPGRSFGSGASHRGVSRPATRPGLEEFEIVNDYLQLRPFLVVFTGPLIKLEMTFNEVLLAFAEILLDHVRQLATGLAVEGFHVNKHGFVVPLARLLILALVVDREAEGRDLASRG